MSPHRSSNPPEPVAVCDYAPALRESASSDFVIAAGVVIGAALTGVSLGLVLQNANDEPYGAYVHSYAVRLISSNIAAGVIWSLYAAWICIAWKRRRVGQIWLLTLILCWVYLMLLAHWGNIEEYVQQTSGLAGTKWPILGRIFN